MNNIEKITEHANNLIKMNLYSMNNIIEDILYPDPDDSDLADIFRRRTGVDVSVIRAWAQAISDSTRFTRTEDELKAARLEGIESVRAAIREMEWSESPPENWKNIDRVFEELKSK